MRATVLKIFVEIKKLGTKEDGMHQFMDTAPYGKFLM